MVVDLHHGLGDANCLLLLGYGAGGVGTTFALEIVQAESLVFSDDLMLHATDDEALPAGRRYWRVPTAGWAIGTALPVHLGLAGTMPCCR